MPDDTPPPNTENDPPPSQENAAEPATTPGLDAALASLGQGEATLPDIDAVLASLSQGESTLPGLDAALASLGEGEAALPGLDAALAALSGMDGLDSLALEDSPPADWAEPLPPAPLPPTLPTALPQADGLLNLERGQAASFVPSFLLMLGGGALTLWLSSGSPAPTWGMVLGMLSLGLGLSLLAQWWSGGRWSEGNLFMGLLLALLGGLSLFLEGSPTFDLANGYPLFIIGLGLAFLLSVALSAAPRQGLAVFGLSLALAGLLALAYSLGNFSTQALELATQAAPVVLLLALAFLVLPLFVRRR